MNLRRTFMWATVVLGLVATPLFASCESTCVEIGTGCARGVYDEYNLCLAQAYFFYSDCLSSGIDPFTCSALYEIDQATCTGNEVAEAFVCTAATDACLAGCSSS
jgi:hypothetical protein